VESPPLAYRVALDRTAPTGRAVLHSGATPWLEIQAEDGGSGVATIQIGDGVTPSNWQPFQVSIPAPLGLASIQVRLRDAAGNVSAPIVAQQTHQLYLPIIAES